MGFELDFDTAESCAENIEIIDEALSQISEQVSKLGTIVNRLESILDSNATKRLNLTSSISTIMDADIAEESLQFTKNQILQQTTSALLVQAQQINSNAILSLIQGL